MSSVVFKFVNKLSSLPTFYALSDKPRFWLFLSAAICLAVGGYDSLFVAPSDYQQGDAFRILYIHVPCAVFSLGVYTFMAVMSLLNLIWRIKLAFILALASSGVGALLTLGALFSGAVWGKPMWGTFWVWDARLTSELLLLILYLGYIALYDALDNKVVAAQACSLLAVLGWIDVPLIHYSVNWWYTLHQGASIVKLAKPSIDTSMLYPLIIISLGFALYIAAIILVRARTIILELEKNAKWLSKIYGTKSRD